MYQLRSDQAVTGIDRYLSNWIWGFVVWDYLDEIFINVYFYCICQM